MRLCGVGTLQVGRLRVGTLRVGTLTEGRLRVGTLTQKHNKSRSNNGVGRL